MARLGVAAVSVIGVAVLTRVLAPAEFGVYALAITTAGTITVVAGQWIRVSLFRFVSASTGDEADILATASMLFGSAVLIVAVGGLAAGLLGLIEFLLVFLVVLLFSLRCAAEILIGYRQARMEASRAIVADVTRAVILVVAASSLAWLGFGPKGAIFGAILGYLISVLLLLRGLQWKSQSQVDRSNVKRFFAYGVPFAATGVLASVLSVSDRYIILWLSGVEDAGLYAATYDIAYRSVHMVISVTHMAYAPLVFRLFERTDKQTAETLHDHASLIGLIAIPLTVALVVLAPWLATFIFPPRYEPAAAEVMPWVIGAAFFMGVQSAYLSYSFSLLKRPIPQAIVFGGGVLLNICLNFLLIPRVGIVGAAQATFVTACLVAFVSGCVGRRMFRLPVPIARMAKVALASAVMGGVLWVGTAQYEPVWLALFIPAGTIAFVLTLFILLMGTGDRLIFDLAQHFWRPIGQARSL